jgi:hypothetical protein
MLAASLVNVTSANGFIICAYELARTGFGLFISLCLGTRGSSVGLGIYTFRRKRSSICRIASRSFRFRSLSSIYSNYYTISN